MVECGLSALGREMNVLPFSQHWRNGNSLYAADAHSASLPATKLIFATLCIRLNAKCKGVGGPQGALSHADHDGSPDVPLGLRLYTVRC